MAIDHAPPAESTSVPPAESDRTYPRNQVSTERRIARSEIATIVDRVTASHGGSTVIGRALQMSRERVDQLRDPDDAASLCFGDALSAARKGARGWAREIGQSFLALVGDAPAIVLSPERMGMQLSVLVGRFNEQLVEFLADGKLSAEERSAAVHELRSLAARAEDMARALERGER